MSAACYTEWKTRSKTQCEVNVMGHQRRLKGNGLPERRSSGCTSEETSSQANFAFCSPSFLDPSWGHSQSLSCSQFFWCIFSASWRTIWWHTFGGHIDVTRVERQSSVFCHWTDGVFCGRRAEMCSSPNDVRSWTNEMPTRNEKAE